MKRALVVATTVLSGGLARDILERRDKILKRFEQEARRRGEAAVFPF